MSISMHWSLTEVPIWDLAFTSVSGSEAISFVATLYQAELERKIGGMKRFGPFQLSWWKSPR